MSSKQHDKYWRDRMADWYAHYFVTKDHPHREMMIEKLGTIQFQSLLDVGCNIGPMLYRIAQVFPRAETAGVDINSGSIEMARGVLPKQVRLLDVADADNLPFSDKSTDVIITDATLLYMDDKKIHRVMKEICRVARNHVIFFEPHSEKWLDRAKFKYSSKNYYIHDYKKLLEKYNIWDIEIRKAKPNYWPEGGTLWPKYGYLISGRLDS